MSSDGKIVTNDHVIDGAQQVQVTLANGSTKSAKVLGAEPAADLAVLEIDAKDLPTVRLGDSSAVHVGDSVVAIGNALALEGGPTVTDGIVSALDRTISEENGVRLQNVLQTDAAINPGTRVVRSSTARAASSASTRPWPARPRTSALPSRSTRPSRP